MLLVPSLPSTDGGRVLCGSFWRGMCITSHVQAWGQSKHCAGTGIEHRIKGDAIMSLAITADKALVWDIQQTKMVQKIRVAVSLVGNQGSVFRETGPLYVETPQEVFEATRLLRTRLIKSLISGVE